MFRWYPYADTRQGLAESPIIVETYSKSGLGLDKGLSPTYDLLVDKYFTTTDGQEGVFSRLRENNCARHKEHVTFITQKCENGEQFLT